MADQQTLKKTAPCNPIQGHRLGLAGALLGQIYKEKRDRFLRKVFDKKTVKPFMKYREIQVIEEILLNLKPKTCIEWGAGYSALYFSGFLTGDARWISVEHDKAWAKRASELVRAASNTKVEICLVEPERASWEEADKEGAATDFKSYLSYPSRFKEIEFILIDGRARKDALVKAHELISERGVVVLHDANRDIYHQPFGLYEHQALFTDSRKDGGGIWVGSKGLDLNCAFDVALHKRLWRVYNLF